VVGRATGLAPVRCREEKGNATAPARSSTGSTSRSK
jgi:hypothetical protein